MKQLTLGKFITFEGIDGCGKTTQLKKIETWLQEKGLPVVTTREPGGTVIGQQIRAVLLHPDHQALRPESELLLYLADRIQHLQEKILPAQQAGQWVLCDRFHDSTIAYQGFGRQLDLRGIASIVQTWITPYLPELTIWLQVSPTTAFRRMVQRKVTDSLVSQEGRLDAESLDFFRRVSEGYAQLAQEQPQRFLCIDANQSIEEVYQTLIQGLAKRFSW